MSTPAGTARRAGTVATGPRGPRDLGNPRRSLQGQMEAESPAEQSRQSPRRKSPPNRLTMDHRPNLPNRQRRVRSGDPVPSPGKRKSIPPKKKRRCKPGTVARREIRKYQGGDNWPNTDPPTTYVSNVEMGTKLFIPKLAFQRIVKEITLEYNSKMRITREALEVMQIATEDTIVRCFQDGNICRKHAKRDTLKLTDFRTAGKLNPFFPVPDHIRLKQEQSSLYAEGDPKDREPWEDETTKIGLYRDDGVPQCYIPYL